MKNYINAVKRPVKPAETVFDIELPKHLNDAFISLTAGNMSIF